MTDTNEEATEEAIEREKELLRMTVKEKEEFSKRVDSVMEYSYLKDRRLVEIAAFSEFVLYNSYSYIIPRRKFDKQFWCLALNDEKSTFSSLTKSKIFDRHLVSLIVDFVTIRGKWKQIDCKSDDDIYWRSFMVDNILPHTVPFAEMYDPMLSFGNLFRLTRKIKINDISIIEVRYETFDLLLSIYMLFLDSPDKLFLYSNVNNCEKFYVDGYEEVGAIYNNCKEDLIFCL